MEVAQSAQHMSHKPVQVHIRHKDKTAIPGSTKWTSAITFLMGNNRVVFKQLKQPIELFMNVTNTVSEKTETGKTINDFNFILKLVYALCLVCML